jgi:hypothetical protein
MASGACASVEPFTTGKALICALVQACETSQCATDSQFASQQYCQHAYSSKFGNKRTQLKRHALHLRTVLIVDSNKA